jgi:rhombotail lipoprotein
VGKWIPLLLITAGMTAAVALSGCAELLCMPNCKAHAHNASSLVDFLYPNGRTPPQQNEIPQLRIPLRVGLAFLPPSEADAMGGLDAAHREQLLEKIKERFSSRKFVADIVLIPDYYLASRRGFEGLESVQRLYGLDLMALVSYDQVMHMDENNWSLGYVTIVGAYVLEGSRHDISTLVDLAVVDPKTHALVLRAGGTDTRHGNTTLMSSERETREAAIEGYGAATDQMTEHFDAALTKFESDVRSGKAAVRMVRETGGRTGGGGALGWWSILPLLMLVTFRRSGRLERMA